MTSWHGEVYHDADFSLPGTAKEPGARILFHPGTLSPLPTPLPSFQGSQFWCLSHPKAPTHLQEEVQETPSRPWLQELKRVQLSCNKWALPFQAEVPHPTPSDFPLWDLVRRNLHEPVQNAVQTSLKSPHIFHFQTTLSS